MGSPRLLVVAALCGAQRIPELPSLPVPNEPFAVLEHVNLNSGRASRTSTSACRGAS